MKNKIVYCKPLSEDYKAEMKQELDILIAKTGVRPKLAIIQVGENPASTTYIKNKKTACEQLGIDCRIIKLAEHITQQDLEMFIQMCNSDSAIHGVFVQFPLPSHLNEKRVAELIAPEKDVDGFHPENVGKLQMNLDTFVPCTPMGISLLLDRLGIDCTGKHCVIIGRSDIVGKPMMQLMLNKNATVTVCHSKTVDLSHHTKQADILIVAVGKAHFIGNYEVIKKGAVIIDVGINRDEDGKLCGDVLMSDEMLEVVSKITPVPGGVGVMTVTMLLHNVIQAYKRSL